MRDIDDRDFFRLEEALPCEYKLINADQTATSNPEEHFDYSEEIQLLGQLRSLQRQGRKLNAELDRQQTPLSQYFSNMNQQIELIGRRVFLNEINAPEQFGSTLTDVSLGGAGLLTQQLLRDSESIALRVLIHEGAWVLTCFARIRYSRMQAEGDGFRSGIEFTGLSIEQLKSLHQYLLNRQSLARRAQMRDDLLDEDFLY